MVCILGIETSCDETAAAIVENGQCVESSVIATQIEVHRRYGGVVPELASRNHLVDIIPVVRDTLEMANRSLETVDAIAVTRGPGLVGALLVGLQVAKSLAYALDKPLIPVHHVAGHLHAVYLHDAGTAPPRTPTYPHLALAVSGGHSAIYVVRGHGQVERIANTRDDAVGEAFDKVARMLGLGYPGGPIVEKLAQEGNPEAFAFTRPKFKDGAFDFSFSGLKTAVLTTIQRLGRVPDGRERADLLASFQAAAIDQLVRRTVAAAVALDIDEVVLAGGVACNGYLRQRMKSALERHDVELFVPPPRWCTDNAAMIAGVAAIADRPQAGTGHRPEDRRINAIASWPL